MKKETKRLKEIIKIIHKHKLLKNHTPENVRLTFEELGPTFVKMGQILASRGDLISEDYAKEFKKLRCSVNAMDIVTVKNILKKEYDNYEDIFESINPKCLGSASIAQTHLAYLKNGALVVIKVQREDIEEKMKMDAQLLKKVVKHLHLNKLFGNVADLDAVIDEMYERSKEEMDFVMEANHILEFTEKNRDVCYIKPLKVYMQYTTKHVLVMDYVDGLFIDQTHKLTQFGYDLEEISYKLANNYLKQVIDDGFYHADPHADNIKINDGKIVFLDLGMMGRLSKQHKILLNKCIIAIVKNDTNKVASVLTTLNVGDSKIDYTSLNNDINNVLNKNKVTNIADIDIKDFVLDMYKLLQKNNIKLPKDITMLIRGITVLEGTLEAINPNINLLQVLKNRISFKDFINKEDIELGLLNVLKSFESFTELPNETLHFIKGVNEGTVHFNVQLTDSDNRKKEKEKFFWIGVFALLDFAFIIGISITSILHNQNLSFIYYLYIVGFIVCTLFLVINYIKCKIKNKL